MRARTSFPIITLHVAFDNQFGHGILTAKEAKTLNATHVTAIPYLRKLKAETFLNRQRWLI